MSSHYICKSRPYGTTTLCEDCICSDSLQLLLDYGREIDLQGILWDKSSLRAIHSLLSHIKHWREALKELARSELSFDEQKDLGLHKDSILDHDADKVIRHLESRGVFPYQRLNLVYGDDRLRTPNGSVSLAYEFYKLKLIQPTVVQCTTFLKAH